MKFESECSRGEGMCKVRNAISLMSDASARALQVDDIETRDPLSEHTFR